MISSAIISRVSRDFAKHYGVAPRWVVAAPGRVNIIGEHTDYNDGFVMPMAIERCTVIAASVATDAKITLHTTTTDQTVIIDLSKPVKPLGKGAWANYPVGVVAGFQARSINVPGFKAIIHSDIPLGGGLSSSAALEVATATLLEAITGTVLDPVEKALLCQKAEHDFAGMPCGIMDQFISVMGRKDHLLLLDCRSRESELVPMSDTSMEVLIINTNVKHELTGSEYSTRRSQCEDAAAALGVASLRDASLKKLESEKRRLDVVVYRRARHVITEIDRTIRAAHGAHASDWPLVGQLMNASHASLRDDYEVSCPELDAVVSIAQNIRLAEGMIGCRMTGGGFGGCTVALVKAVNADAISKKITHEYHARTGITATIFNSRPAAGAIIVKS